MKKIFVLAGMALLASCADNKGTDAAGKINQNNLKDPKEAIAPGATGAIKVVYNGSGNGNITKTVTLTTNTEQGTETLTINANVKP